GRRRPSPPLRTVGHFGLIAGVIFLAALIAAHGRTEGLRSRAAQVSPISRGRPIGAARRAVGLDPLDVAALRDLGLALDGAGHGDQADTFFTLADRLSRRDVATEAWLFQRRLRQARVDEAFFHADCLLRVDEDQRLRARTFAVFDLAEENDDALAALARRLELDPPWRTAFLQSLPPGREGLAGAWRVLNALAAGPAPATVQEAAPLLDRLVDLHFYQSALSDYAVVKRRASLAQTLLRDGGFDGEVDGTPFSWSEEVGDGATARVEANEGARVGRALRVEYDSYAQPSLPGQLLVLAPGRYRLSWLEKGDGASAGAALAWTVRCAESPSPLAASADGGGQGWREANLTFDVPGSRCGAQWLRLEAEPGERRQSLIRWFAAMSLARLDQASSASAPQQKAKNVASASVRRG
ncbi:MAG: hypothetical protein ACYC8V_11545, partial [Caulobacteraceae bacterium]